MGSGTELLAPLTPVQIMELKSILNWSEPALSGLGVGSGFVFVFSLSHFSLLLVLAYFALTFLLFGVGCKVYVHLMGTLKKPCKDPLAKIEVIDMTLDSEKLEATLSKVVESLNEVIIKVRGLCLLQNYVESAKFASLLYVASYIGAVFNTLTLLTIAWVAVFVVPTVYQQNQAKVDDVLAQVKTQYETINQKVAAMLPAEAAAKKEEKLRDE